MKILLLSTSSRYFRFKVLASILSLKQHQMVPVNFSNTQMKDEKRDR